LLHMVATLSVERLSYYAKIFEKTLSTSGCRQAYLVGNGVMIPRNTLMVFNYG